MAHYDRKDHFHQRAQREGFRPRAAYKLQEIQKAHRVLSTGQRVADRGWRPGRQPRCIDFWGSPCWPFPVLLENDFPVRLAPCPSRAMARIAAAEIGENGLRWGELCKPVRVWRTMGVVDVV